VAAATKSPSKDRPRYLTLDEAAQRFHLHPMTVRRYLREGLLVRYRRKLDRRTYIDLDELLALRSQQPQPVKKKR
jgi:DNA-binding transcriptional MerR regulator